MSGAPKDCAKTTANAEFCIPFSMEIVQLVCSLKWSTLFWTKKPARNPIKCKKTTDPTTLGNTSLDVTPSASTFCDTTPLWVNDTNKIDANGVTHESVLESRGTLAFKIMPRTTGNKTTCAVAQQRAHLLIWIVDPTKSLTSSGVTALARIVEQVVSSTDSYGKLKSLVN